MKAAGRFSYDRELRSVYFGTTLIAGSAITHYFGERLAADLQAEINCACETELGRWKLARESTPQMGHYYPVLFTDGDEGFAQYVAPNAGWFPLTGVHRGADVVMWYDVPAHPPIPKELKCKSATASALLPRSRPTSHPPSPAPAAGRRRKAKQPAATTRPSSKRKRPSG